VCFVVLHSSKDHLRTGTHNLDHPISCRCKKTWIVGMPRRGICSVLFLQIISMVPSSSITISANAEHLTCGRFSLGEPISMVPSSSITIAHYFGGLSLSPRRGDEGTTFVGSTHSGASTPQRATMEDSTKELLTTSSGEGSFGHPSLDGVARGPRSSLP
jgi:hypothetical protein